MLLLFCSTYFLVNGKSCTKVKAVAFIRRLYSKIEKDVGYKALQKYYDKWSIRPLKQTVRDAISPHNLREVFRQQLKVDGIDTVFRITPPRRENLRRNVYRPQCRYVGQRFGIGKRVLNKYLQ